MSTPAIAAVRRGDTPHAVHRYEHDPSETAFGAEASAVLGVHADRVFKTLVVDAAGQLSVGIVPVSGELDLRAFASAVGAKSAGIAARDDAERVTGYVVGGISPLGQKKRLPTVIDASAQTWDTIFVSAGRRGLELELSPADLAALTGATFAAIRRPR